jgi:hypothetical protein
MAGSELQSQIAATEERVGNEPESRSWTGETSLAQTTMKVEERVQTAQLQSLFDEKDENTK